ncbi:MAG: MFS transporter [Hyphomicrobium sp.]|nr:MFS transporter [Hyphomicrobium sp.]
MQNRWTVLALLFTVRLAMAFQFQAAGAVSPAFMNTYGVALADIGLLISIYLAPGILFAVPGGEIGRRFGDKSVVLFGLALMIAGGLVMAMATSWHGQLAGRLLAGIGGVLINVLMSKMVTDWFAGKEIATAMAIFVNSWPAGIAIALMVLPVVAAAGGVVAVAATTAVLALIGLILLAALYQAPTDQRMAAGAASTWPEGNALRAVLAAGCIWGLYNAALGMVFGYGTALLTERGWSLTTAGSATSLVLWLVALSVPLGGFIADRTGRPREVMLAGFALFALALFAGARADAVVLTFVMLGLVSGLPAGPIMSLPSRVLAASTRATGMGLYFSMFYVTVVLAPILAGRLAEFAGTARATFDLGVAMLLGCMALVWCFDRLAMRHNMEQATTA